MNKRICVDTESLNKEIASLQEEKSNLLNVKNKIKNNYEKFNDLSLEGTVIDEIKNNYEYGLENIDILIKEFEKEIEKVLFSQNNYESTLSNIEEKVGERNE